MTATLVYLHGIGAEHDDAWRAVLDEALRAAGFPGLDDVTCCAPKYPHTLRYPSDENHPLPPETTPRLTAGEYTEVRWRVERATADLERAVGAHAAGRATPLAAETVPAVMRILPQARRYLEDDDTRANTLHRVLAALPDAGPIVLVAHSLGSIIAVDLVTRLPPDVEVVAMITLGSPAGQLALHRGGDRARVLRDPPANVGWWLNVWGGADLVTGLRGISHRFPWVLDIALPAVRHPMENYLSSAIVATAIGRALFGSSQRELATTRSLPEPEIDDVELHAYLLLAYAHFLASHLPESRRDRFLAALTRTRSDLVERLGLSDDRVLPDPARMRTLSKSTALLPLLALATTNPIAPYQVSITAAARRRALQDLAVWIGLYSGYGVSLQRALTRASSAVAPTWADRIWWRRRPRDAAELDPIELTAIRLVAAELARRREGLDGDPAVYPALARVEGELAQDQARLAPFCDPRASTLQLLRRQRQALARAMRILRRNHLAPTGPAR